MITDSLHEYESLALHLARAPRTLRDLRERLARNRISFPLFDTDRFRRQLESAYRKMWELHQRGESPRGFDVDAEP